MPNLPDPAPALKPSIVAALLLMASDQRRQLATALFPSLTAAEIVTATGSSRSQAYEMKRRLLGACATLHESAGRPPSKSPPSKTRVTSATREAVHQRVGVSPVSLVLRAEMRQNPR
jgi:hypothetical protein